MLILPPYRVIHVPPTILDLSVLVPLAPIQMKQPHRPSPPLPKRNLSMMQEVAENILLKDAEFTARFSAYVVLR
jgi:hypothetical protein